MAKWNVNPSPKAKANEVETSELPEINDDFEEDGSEELKSPGFFTEKEEKSMNENETSWIKMAEDLSVAEAAYKKAKELYLELLANYENRLAVEKEAMS